jgi:hypothetical protein
VRLHAVLVLPLLAAASRPGPAQTRESARASPAILTHFGERADFSPDNRRIAFMNKSFGDAFVIDLQTKIVGCLTGNVPGAAFLRVMHLITGDYILIGADHFEDIHTIREA